MFSAGLFAVPKVSETKFHFPNIKTCVSTGVLDPSFCVQEINDVVNNKNKIIFFIIFFRYLLKFKDKQIRN